MLKSLLFLMVPGSLFWIPMLCFGAAAEPTRGGEKKQDTGKIVPPSPAAYREVADAVEANLRRDILAKWFPQALDKEHGGYYQNFRQDWSRDPRNDKAIVYQARLTWIAAEAALRYPAEAEQYRAYSLQGLDFLANKLWDKENGGLFWNVDETGQPNTQRGGEKHVYGIAFSIYADCACFQATKEPRALDLAKRTFAWMDAKAHDAHNGGYYEALQRDGKPILAPLTTPGASPGDAIGTHYGYKSMNTHIHLLEALTALYGVWPDAHVHARLREIFLLVRDRIAVAPGCLNLFFTPDWRPVPDYDSFGHDIETAFLLTEAAEALGMHEDSKTRTVARQLVDHALQYGWDGMNGGFYDSGTAFGAPTETDKIWWVEAEGLNALLLMHAQYGKETPRYWQAFLKQWEFIRDHQVDAQHGGWYPTVSRDGTPVPEQAKSDQWTEAYHQGRAMLNVSAELRRLSERTP